MMLTIQGISKAYGMAQVLAGVSFVLNDGERLGLVGPNGVGKSTLLKIITGQLEPDGGMVSHPAGVTVGYLPQSVAAGAGQTVAALIDRALAELRVLEKQMRALETQMAAGGAKQAAVLEAYGAALERYEARGGYEQEHRIATVLTGLKVAHIERTRAISTLSGGERARLSLALLLLSAPDVLLLDEPTNHLDGACLDWLERYLSAYRGGMLIVSHDREFLNRTVSAILEIDEHSGQVRRYAGNYDAYMAARALAREQWATDYARQQE